MTEMNGVNTKVLRRLWYKLSKKRKRQFFMIFGLMLMASLLEIMTLGSALPFFSVLTAPEKIFAHPVAGSIFRNLGLNSPDELLLPLTLLFGVAAFLAGAIKLLLLWSTNQFSCRTSVDLGVEIYSRTLYQEYGVHIRRNSSEMISALTIKIDGLTNILLSTLNLMSAVILAVSVLSVLFYVNFAAAVVLLFGFGGVYGVLLWGVRRRIRTNGYVIAEESTKMINVVREGLYGIRDVILNGAQRFYSDIYRSHTFAVRQAAAQNDFLRPSPRYAIEALGLLLLALIAYWAVRYSEDVTDIIPVLGVFVLGLQRLLPVLQQGYSAWANMIGFEGPARDSLDLMEQPLPAYLEKSCVREPVIKFEKSIEFKAVSFSYSEEVEPALREVSLRIEKGECIGVIGETGSGKSTFLDLIMGFLWPSSGVIEIDGVPLTRENIKVWQDHIAHVPQSIYLADRNVYENVAFAVDECKIEQSRVHRAAHYAQVKEVIESMPDDYRSVLGENGVRLSGGQRQRIGIARALYKNANIIIFDEATSALDGKTEEKVIKGITEIEGTPTIIMVAHRISSLNNCNKVIEFDGGKVKEVIDYMGRGEGL